jgi:hypothetical protein
MYVFKKKKKKSWMKIISSIECIYIIYEGLCKL